MGRLPLFWLSLAFLGGICARWLLGGPLPIWLNAASLLSSASLLVFHLCVRRSTPTGWSRAIAALWPPDHETLLPGFILPALPLFLLLGALRYQATLPAIDQNYLAWYNDRPGRALVVGLVASDPERREANTQLELEAERLQPPDSAEFTPVKGRLLVRLPPGGDWRYGDRMQIEGRLRTPSEIEEFSYKTYLSHHGIYSTLSCYYCQTCDEPLPRDCAWLIERGQGNPLKSPIYGLRQNALRVIYRLFPDPEAALLAGILLGIETGIPQDVLEAFRLTGTSHIIAISGFNFAIIAGLFVLVFGRLLGRWRGMLAAWLGIGVYAALAGASAGVVRAAIMGGLAIFAIRLGRGASRDPTNSRSSGLNTLTFVAALMALHDPHVLWDVGFQLSFMATLGLVLYADPLAGAFTRFVERWTAPQTARRLAGPAGEYLLFTLAAQVTTLPLILFYFRQVSLVSLLANPLVLPAQPPLMVLGGLAVILGLFSQALGGLAAALAWPWIAFTIRVVELLAQVRGAALSLGAVSIWPVLGFYLLLFSWTLWGGRLRLLAARFKGEVLPRSRWALSLGLLLVLIVVWQRVSALPDGRLHLTVLDVGAGEALLIQTPTGRSVLVNGGPSPNALSDALGRRLSFGSGELDYLVVGAGGEEQLAALPACLDRFRVRNVLWAGPVSAGYSARELRKRLAQERIPVVAAQQGHVLDLGAGARLELIAVTRKGAVLLLEYGRFRLLLPVGLDFEGLDALTLDRTQEAVTAMLLAEGGFGPLNPPEWIERWSPQVALLSVAAGNPDSLPAEETLDALEGYTLLRTDQNGWIELSTDGEQMWVEVERR